MTDKNDKSSDDQPKPAPVRSKVPPEWSQKLVEALLAGLNRQVVLEYLTEQQNASEILKIVANQSRRRLL